MAEVEEEELVLLEDDEEEEIEKKLLDDSDETTVSTKKSSNLLLIIIISFLILLLIGLGTFFILKKDQNTVKTQETNASTIIENIKKNNLESQNTSPLAKLTSKAKELYESGKTDEALKIYQKISFFHKSLASFNLGVADIKDKKYKEAIKKFEEAFALDDLKFESSLNKAICYKYLNDKENFQKEIKKADEFIISKYNSPLFDYYFGILEYYKDNPFESMIVLKKYNSTYNSKNRNTALAKEYTYIKNYNLATEAIVKTKNSDYLFTMGQLYAKNGEYSLAEKAFRNSLKNKKYPMLSRVALSLVQNKLGLFEECSSNLKTINSKYGDKATKLFPIKVMIKKSLYDPVKAQREFKSSIFNDKKNRFGLIFYYSPYKLYDPSQSNNIIEKGAKEIYIDNISSANAYLNQASSISQINLEIIKGLKLLEKHKVYEANTLFKTLIDKYPNHSVLHYNLALTYANIGDFKNANKHFDKSYILDSSNYLALFYTAYTDVLQNKDFDEKALENVMKYANKKTRQELTLLYKIINNDSAINIEKDIKNRPFDLILNIIAANILGDEKLYTEYSRKLKTILPKDLVANIIYVDQTNKDKNIKDYAKSVQENLTGTNLDISPLIYGGVFARELYIKILSIAGVTRIAKERLENELHTNQNQVSLLLSLAYTYIYTKEYEKSYQLYNKIIDDFKVDDPHTLFLASVAGIGSKHHANAIALLELANLDDKNQYESRYALGLLYQEAKNFEGAAIQYVKIGNSGFKSKYFDFDLKH